MLSILSYLGGLKIMKKVLIGALIFSLLLAGMTACNDKKEADVKCKTILEACSKIAKEATFDTITAYGDELYDNSFNNLYGIQKDMIDDGAISYTESGGVADEISIVHLKKNEDVSIAKEKFQNRIEERKKVFGGYKPKEISKLDEATIMVQGNYVALIISEDNSNFEVEIRKTIGGQEEK